MKIASVLGYLAPCYGGPPNMAIKLGQQLQKYGIYQTLWATASDTERKDLAYLGDRAVLFKAEFPCSWYRSSKLRRKMDEQMPQIDLLHLHQIWDHPVYAAAQLAQRHGKPYLITPHGIFTQIWRYKSLKKRIYLRYLAVPFLNNAACIHAVSNAELKGFQEVGIKAPFSIVPNGVAPEEFVKLPPQSNAEHIWPRLHDRLMVLYMGRLSPEKGLDQLIHSWAQITRRIPRAYLMIAGPDFRGYEMRLRRQIQALGLEESVCFSGLLSGDAKKAALSRANVYVQPSYSEGFSGSVLEALACAKPCVITTGCNLPAIVEAGAGDIVEPEAEMLATALWRLLSLTERERCEMGERGRQLVARHFTWDLAARRMLTVYRCILDGKAIPLHPEPVRDL